MKGIPGRAAKRYRKRPLEVTAVQLRWDNWGEMCDHADVGRLRDGKPQGCYVGPDGRGTDRPSDQRGLWIPTLEGLMLARQGDWVIRGTEGELYPCKPSVFEATYEEVESE